MAFDPVTAAIDFGTSAVQSYGNYKTAQAINEANIQMQRETNAQNYKMFQEQNEFNRQMVAEQNAYNLPSEQVARYRAAGLNPYLMMSGGASSVQSSPAQSGNPNPMVSPKIDPSSYTASWQMLGEGIRSATQQMYQNESIRQDIQAKKIDNVTRMYENWARIRKYESDSGLSWAQKGYLHLQSQYYEQAIPYMLEGIDIQNNQNLAQTNLYKQEVVKIANDMRIDNIQSALNIRISKHTIQQIDSQTNLNYQKLKESIQNILESKSRESKNYSDIDLNGAYYQNLIYGAAKQSAETVESILRSNGHAIDNAKSMELFRVEYATMVAKLRTELKNGLTDPMDIFNLLNPAHYKFGADKFDFLNTNDDPYNLKKYFTGYSW